MAASGVARQPSETSEPFTTSSGDRFPLVIPPQVRRRGDPTTHYVDTETVRELGEFCRVEPMLTATRAYFLATWCVENSFGPRESLIRTTQLRALVARLNAFPMGARASLLTEGRYSLAFDGAANDQTARRVLRRNDDPFGFQLGIGPRERAVSIAQSEDNRFALRVIIMNEALSRPEHGPLVEAFVRAGGHRPASFELASARR